MAGLKNAKSRKDPMGKTNRPLKLKSNKGRDGKTYYNLKGSIPMEDNTSFAVSVQCNSSGVPMVTDIVDKNGVKSKGIWLNIAQFEND